MTAEEIMKQQPVVLQGSYELASTALRLAQSMRRLEEKGVDKEDTEVRQCHGWMIINATMFVYNLYTLIINATMFLYYS